MNQACMRQTELTHGLFLPRVITGTRPHGQLLVRASMCVDVNFPKTTHTFGSRWLVANGVLVADIVRDITTDLIHLIERRWKESDSPCPVGQNFKSPFGTPRLLFSQQTNGVDRGTILLL